MSRDSRAVEVLDKLLEEPWKEPIEVLQRAAAALPQDWREWSSERGFEYIRSRLEFTQDELSNKSGGPLAVQPSKDTKRFVPQSQVYLVGIYIDNPDRAIHPGVRAQVKIHCEYRSCAWWVWRKLSSVFDLGLL